MRCGTEDSLLIFKEKDPRMQALANNGKYKDKGKIFFHIAECIGQYHSYGINKINEIFTQDENVRNLKERMIQLMVYLQDGFHSNEYHHKAGEYPHAKEEYPELYRILAQGLNEDTLAKIRESDLSKISAQLPSDLGAKFVDQLVQDKQRLHTSSSKRGGANRGR